MANEITPAEGAKTIALYKLPFISQIADWAAKKNKLASVNDLPAFAVGQVKELKDLVISAVRKPSIPTIRPALEKFLKTSYNPFTEVAIFIGLAGYLFGGFKGANKLNKLPIDKVGGLITKLVKYLPMIAKVAGSSRGTVEKILKVVK